MEDYAYTLFEDHLIQSGLVAVVANDTFNDHDRSFIKVRSRLRLNDLAATHKVMKYFNEIGEAFWRVANTEAVSNNLGKRMSDGDVKKNAAASGMQLGSGPIDVSVAI